MTIISSILSYNKPNVTRHLCCVQLLIIVIVSFSGMIYECDAQWRKGKPPLHDDESQTRKPIKPSQTRKSPYHDDDFHDYCYPYELISIPTLSYKNISLLLLLSLRSSFH